MDSQSTVTTAHTPKATTPTSPVFKPLPSRPAEPSSPPSVPERSIDRFSKTAEVRIPKRAPERPLKDRASTTPAAPQTASVSERFRNEDDPFDLSKFDTKPKVKLGPRPVAPGEKAKRPTTASVATLPATYRPTMKEPEQSRPKSQGPIAGAVPAIGGGRGLPAPPPIPDMPEYNPRPVSRGSVKSLPSHKSTGMTADKIRLMKAVELRKKQLRKSNPQADTFVPPPEEEIPAVPKLPEQLPTQETENAAEQSLQPEITSQADQKAPSNKADSGIAMEYDKAERGDDPNATTEPQAEEVRQTPAELSQPSTKEELPIPQSPRVDTPRVDSSQASRISEPDLEPRSTQDMPEDEDCTEFPTPLNASDNDSWAFNQTSDQRSPVSPIVEDAASVPKIVMADGSRPISANLKQSKSEESSPVGSDTEPKSADQSNNGVLDAPEKHVRRQNSDIAKRRRGFVEPLHIDPDDFDSDDEFMEELQTATLQEAKPITVARSPVAHYFPRRPSNNSAVSDISGNSTRDINVENRSSTMPLDFADMQERLTPDPSFDPRRHSRSASTPPTESNDPMSAMKRNVSNGISKRVQALAERSSLENSMYGAPGRPLTPETAPNGYAPQDRRESRRSPPPTSRTSSFRAMSRHSSRMSSYQSQAAMNGVPRPESTAVWNVQRDASSNVDSVSVTARIVRPSAPERVESTPEQDEELQPSQLIVNHRRGTPSQTTVPHLHRIDTNPEPEVDKTGGTASRGNSPTMVRGGSVEGYRTLHSANKPSRQVGSLSPIGPTAEDFPPPPTSRIQTSHPPPYNDENSAPKEGTRTSRFFKRMSNIGGNKRRSVGPQSIGSSGSPASERGSLTANNASLPGSKDKPELPPALTVGDLNIQFPDSLVSQRSLQNLMTLEEER